MTTILSVDADSRSADILQAGLTCAGYTVAAAYTAAQALEMVAQLQPDLVLLDCNLPDGDGLELCAYLRTDLDVPVIMVTAQADDTSVMAGFDHGADDYVAKPAHKDILIHRINAVLRYRPGRLAARATPRDISFVLPSRPQGHPGDVLRTLEGSSRSR